MADFFCHCFFSGGYWFISARRAWSLLKQGVLLADLRPSYVKAGKIPDVPKLLSIPYTEITRNINLLPKEIPIILADAVGLRSKECLIQLNHMGFDNLASLAGGFVDWERSGLPMKIDPSMQLHGPCMCQLKPPKS